MLSRSLQHGGWGPSSTGKQTPRAHCHQAVPQSQALRHTLKKNICVPSVLAKVWVQASSCPPRPPTLWVVGAWGRAARPGAGVSTAPAVTALTPASGRPTRRGSPADLEDTPAAAAVATGTGRGRVPALLAVARMVLQYSSAGVSKATAIMLSAARRATTADRPICLDGALFTKGAQALTQLGVNCRRC